MYVAVAPAHVKARTSRCAEGCRDSTGLVGVVVLTLTPSYLIIISMIIIIIWQCLMVRTKLAEVHSVFHCGFHDSQLRKEYLTSFFLCTLCPGDRNSGVWITSSTTQ